MPASPRPPTRYRIRIRIGGHLGPDQLTAFDNLTVTPGDDGTTELVGPLVDRAALFGLLGQLRDLVAPLLLVERVADDVHTAKPRFP